MSRLHVFIDGTWLFNQCGAGQSLANATDAPNARFPLDFTKMDQSLLDHVRDINNRCDSLGDRFISTSIFALPSNFDKWPEQYDDISLDQVDRTRRGVYARQAFLNMALAAGYSDAAVFRPPIKDYIVRKLSERRYQEKQVDTSVVALLVKSAITCPSDFHVVITGDSDILPAIRVAYPDYTHNVVIATTHPDELNAAHRQTSFSLFDFEFDVKPFFLQNNAERIIKGSHVHKCAECGKVFSTARPLGRMARPYCSLHSPARRRP